MRKLKLSLSLIENGQAFHRFRTLWNFEVADKRRPIDDIEDELSLDLG